MIYREIEIKNEELVSSSFRAVDEAWLTPHCCAVLRFALPLGAMEIKQTTSIHRKLHYLLLEAMVLCASPLPTASNNKEPV